MDKQTIAIIDDDVFLSKATKIFLEKQGFNTILAQNGVEGLEVIKGYNPDLILCDRAMPKLSGYSLLEKIRNEYPQYNQIPFIFLTSLGDRRDKMATVGLRPSSYLTKPVNYDELLAVVRSSLAVNHA